LQVSITGHNAPPSTSKPSDQIIRYDFVREAGGWKIDDIKSTADDEPWSIRGPLTEALKH
jgi:hypothetical protein